jgi:hypothetical protein
MSTGFGQWYEEQKTSESGNSEAASSWFGGADTLLPLVGDPSQMVDFSSIRASMESAMPQKVMGMNYQQRFRVSTTKTIL